MTLGVPVTTEGLGWPAWGGGGRLGSACLGEQTGPFWQGQPALFAAYTPHPRTHSPPYSTGTPVMASHVSPELPHQHLRAPSRCRASCDKPGGCVIISLVEGLPVARGAGRQQRQTHCVLVLGPPSLASPGARRTGVAQDWPPPPHLRPSCRLSQDSRLQEARGLSGGQEALGWRAPPSLGWPQRSAGQIPGSPPPPGLGDTRAFSKPASQN